MGRITDTAVRSVNLGTISATGQTAVTGQNNESDRLIVTLSSDTPTGTAGPAMDATLEKQAPSGGAWSTVATFAQLTASNLSSIRRTQVGLAQGSALRLNVTTLGGTTPAFPNTTVKIVTEKDGRWHGRRR
jgi:hypothetical protein